MITTEDEQSIVITGDKDRLVISKVTGLIMWNDVVVTIDDDFHREQVINFIRSNMK